MDSIVFDTGSSYYVLETIDCTDCTITYDYSDSTDTYTEIANSDIS